MRNKILRLYHAAQATCPDRPSAMIRVIGTRIVARGITSMSNISEQERFRRGEYARDSRAALAQNETLEQRLAKCETKADIWAQWFRQKMDASGCDPVELLPDAFAKLEQTIDDRVTAAINEIKATLRGALK